MSSKSKSKRRLDELLVDAGYFADVREARSWIMAGEVVFDGTVCEKPGTLVRADADVALKRFPQKYASRGGLKLEAALERFAIDVSGRCVLDAGASAGGFTDCLLQRGARRVYAVDVGFGQIRGKLASDGRVVNWERTNISDLRAEKMDPPIDFCVVDLSYLSLVKAIPVICKLFVAADPELVSLIKPLFEGVSQAAPRDSGLLRQAIETVCRAAEAEGLVVRDVMRSPVVGGRGTIEFLGYFSRRGAPANLEDRIRGALADIDVTPVVDPTSADKEP
jgi:23S rRNA (cytidine1920-2'-O)/16S rRNA (cytidine1409-2'-O)-methyltransferase